MPFDVQRIREDFPCLHQDVRGRPLVYLDNAATGQSPQCVSDVMARFHIHHRANVHRGVHELSQRATKAYEQVRAKVQKFLGAREEKEIIFTSGTTESINLVADTWGRQNLGPGDGVLITEMEHHSNIVPWQMVAEQTGAIVRHLPLNDDGELILDDLDQLLEQSKLFAVTHISNALGTINPVKELVQRAHEKGVLVLVDGAQAVPHLPIDVVDLDCDFYCFSGHKLFGPTGVG
ncbi:MAG: aminotransferase class V-fold PLP-dependent enzyme, partial [Proteobacteria bacterium]|nr:aminotransferase class V-fold PLP-dependent enzyme [Pseudomonadota bacterium]